MQTVMEITRLERAGCPELLVSGRLDSYWARHLAEAIDELMREGIHQARLNLSQTTYISSAGIRVLVQGFQQFSAVGGALLVVDPSLAVRQVLDLAGLEKLFCAPAAPEQAATPGESVVWRYEDSTCSYEGYDCHPGARLDCRVAGRPDLLASAGFREEHAECFRLAPDVFALGLGAFGDTYAACRERFGEFLAVAGCAACQPTDETGCADDMISSGTFVPRMTTLYSVCCRGKLARLLRFEGKPGAGPVALGSVVAACIAAADNPVAGLVLVAESAGLLGASLKRSPAGTGGGALFRHPEVRQWLSFSPVRSHARSVAIIAGVAARSPAPPALAALLRPLKTGSDLLGHFHAAAFGYHPLRKGYLELDAAVRRLFESGGLQGVLHLLADDRPGAGAGESEFTRGACWVGPLERILSAEESL
ncbi:MAG: STAS domain-containing protein [Acidobacteria bacterium]|nr:STAS domain-containing protein [Acidobacteriota bacterium]